MPVLWWGGSAVNLRATASWLLPLRSAVGGAPAFCVRALLLVVLTGAGSFVCAAYSSTLRI